MNKNCQVFYVKYTHTHTHTRALSTCLSTFNMSFQRSSMEFTLFNVHPWSLHFQRSSMEFTLSTFIHGVYTFNVHPWSLHFQRSSMEFTLSTFIHGDYTFNVQPTLKEIIENVNPPYDLVTATYFDVSAWRRCSDILSPHVAYKSVSYKTKVVQLKTWDVITNQSTSPPCLSRVDGEILKIELTLRSLIIRGLWGWKFCQKLIKGVGSE